jgi:hypothetical protein
MKNYTVVWRDGGDHYMLTEVETDVDPNLMTSAAWVSLAGEVEYAEWDEVDRVAALADLLDGYDLLVVLFGHPQSVF